MSKNWSLAIVVAFVMGYSLKVYMDMQQQVALEKQQQAMAEIAAEIVADPVFTGEKGKLVHLFNPDDSRIRIVYFGYIRCPDVCPTSLAMLAAALKEISAEQSAKVRPMFISIDPERDEADAAHQYAQYFHNRIEGFSAPLEVTKAVANQYGVIFRKTELEDSAIDYVVDHSSYFYFLKPDGSLITQVPHTLDPATIVAAIKDVLANDQI